MFNEDNLEKAGILNAAIEAHEKEVGTFEDASVYDLWDQATTLFAEEEGQLALVMMNRAAKLSGASV